MASLTISWIGRLTGPKGQLAERILREICPLFPQVQFRFVGGPITEQWRQWAGPNVTLMEYSPRVAEVILSSQLVIGAGRVVMESLICGVPAIAVGEKRYVGLIDEHNLALAKATNFGDCDYGPGPDLAPLIADLKRILADGLHVDPERLKSYVGDYDARKVGREVMSVYQEARMEDYLDRFAEVPVLMYHRVTAAPLTDSKFNVYVTAADLETQLRTLLRRGYTPITFRDLARGEQPRKPVLLTFDDGYEDNHQFLLPLLRKLDCKATIFALGERSLNNNLWDMRQGEPEARLMSDEQLRECHRSGLIEIASHGMRHPHLPQLSATGLAEEMMQSKANLEQVIGAEVISFAYPFGDYGEREVGAAQQAGYRFAIGTVNGPAKFADDLYRIRRVQIFPKESAWQFFKKSSGYYLRYCRWRGKDR